jgi:allantoin racemase
MAEAARRVAAPGTLVVGRQPTFGPASIEGFYDDVFGAAGVAEQVKLAGAERFDAVVIACFGDPGLDAARELARGPVVGIAEAAMRSAAYLSTGFSVVTTLARTVVIAEHLVDRYGVRSHCRRVRAIDLPVLALEDPACQAYDSLLAECRRALAEDGCGAIVLGCAGMAHWCRALTDALGVPVIDGVGVATATVEALLRAGLRTSKRGDYAPPLPKTYTGAMAPWSPPGG